MNWTRKAPTVAGWYWWRRDQHALPGVAIACSDLSGYYMNRTGHNSTFDHVDDVIGEWLGPLSPDSYQQGRVAGLREAAIICRERGKPHDIQWWMTASKKEVSAQTAIDCAELIEQYAQDEKGVGG